MMALLHLDNSFPGDEFHTQHVSMLTNEREDFSLLPKTVNRKVWNMCGVRAAAAAAAEAEASVEDHESREEKMEKFNMETSVNEE